MHRPILMLSLLLAAGCASAPRPDLETTLAELDQQLASGEEDRFDRFLTSLAGWVELTQARWNAHDERFERWGEPLHVGTPAWEGSILEAFAADGPFSVAGPPALLIPPGETLTVWEGLHDSVYPQAMARGLRERMLAWVRDPSLSERLRYGIFSWARELEEDGVDTAADLAKALLDEQGLAWLRELALRILGDKPDVARAVRTRLAQLSRRDPNPELRRLAIAALPREPAALAPLLVAMTDGSSAVRGEVALALGDHGRAALPALLAMTFDRSPAVQAMACAGLRYLGSAADPLARRRLLALALADRDGYGHTQGPTSSPSLHAEAVWALRWIVPPAELRGVLQPLMHDPDGALVADWALRWDGDPRTFEPRFHRLPMKLESVSSFDRLIRFPAPQAPYPWGFQSAGTRPEPDRIIRR